MGLLTGKYNDGNIPEGTRFTSHSTMKKQEEKYFGEKTKENTVRVL